jgi:hypothetical protein
MSGELSGGWTFVWAAYIVVWTGLVLYGASLVSRRASASTSLPPVNGNDGGER